jgi:hypothetical protein
MRFCYFCDSTVAKRDCHNNLPQTKIYSIPFGHSTSVLCFKEGSGLEAISDWIRVNIFLPAHRTGQASCFTDCNVQKQIVVIRCTSKGKVHPRTGHEGPEGEQMYRSTLPSTSALRWGWVVNATPRPL